MSEQQAPSKQGDVTRPPRSRQLIVGSTVALITAVLVIAAQMERSASVEPSERIGRRMQLTELIAQERDRAQSLQQQVEDLTEEIAAYESTAAAGSAELTALQERVDEVGIPGGLMAVAGTGLVVTLEDSSRPFDGEEDPNMLVIHQQDLRGVVNALWAGGAEALSINGERVLSTSGVYCVGNTLYLNGKHFAPPFVVEAIGDPEALAQSIERDDAVQRFVSHADEFDMGFDVEEADELLVAAHPGTFSLNHAVPASSDR